MQHEGASKHDTRPIVDLLVSQVGVKMSLKEFLAKKFAMKLWWSVGQFSIICAFVGGSKQCPSCK